MNSDSGEQGSLLVKIEKQIGGRKQYLHIQLVDNNFRVVRSVYTNHFEYNLDSLPYGNYELQVSTMRGAKTSRVISIDEDYIVVEVLHPEGRNWPVVRLGLQGEVLETSELVIKSRNEQDGESENSVLVDVWRFNGQHWLNEATLELIRYDAYMYYEIEADSEGYTIGLEFISSLEGRSGNSRFLIVPSGKVRVQVNLIEKSHIGGEFISVHVFFENEISNVLIDLLSTGEVASADFFLANETVSMVHGESNSSSEVLISAIFLDMRDRRDVGGIRGMRSAFKGWIMKPDIRRRIAHYSDWNVFVARKILERGVGTRYWALAERLLDAQTHVPNLSISIKMLYEWLCQLEEVLSDEEISNARERVGEWMRHLVKFQPFTMFRNYRPVEYTDSWEPVGGLDSFEGFLVPLSRR